MEISSTEQEETEEQNTVVSTSSTLISKRNGPESNQGSNNSSIIVLPPRLVMRPVKPRTEIKVKQTFFIYSQSGVVLEVPEEIKKFENSPTNIKIYSCGACGLFTQLENDLNEHLETHMNEKDKNHETAKPPKNLLIKVIQKTPFIKPAVETESPKPASFQLTLPKIPIVRTFPCVKCGKKFTRKSALQTHQLVHTQEKVISCKKCEDSPVFETREELAAHDAEQHPKGVDQDGNQDEDSIDLPNSPSPRRIKTVVHRQRRPYRKAGDVQNKYPCEQCGKEFKSYAVLRSHLATHSNNRPYSCSQCGKSFLSKAYLHWHKVRHSEERPFVCHICGNGYKMKKDLNQHILTHTNVKSHRCHICGRAFLFKNTLTKHMLVHSDKRPFVCDRCGRSFKERFKLKVHMFIHDDIRPFVCEVCGKAFRQRCVLMAHIKAHHDSNAKTGDSSNLALFTCNTCKKSFKSKSYLIKHEMKHQNLKPSHLCDLCGKAFLYRDAMVKHRNLHVQDRIFSCDKCDKAFKTKPSLKMHQLSHLDVKTQNCEFCGKLFKTIKTMRRHIRRLHPSTVVPEAKVDDNGSFNQTSEVQSARQAQSGPDYPISTLGACLVVPSPGIPMGYSGSEPDIYDSIKIAINL